MKAVRYHTLGGPEVLRYEEVPAPRVADQDVLIEMAAAGVNFADLNRVRGLYPVKPTFPAMLGSEVAGTVTQVGSAVTDFKTGDRVMGWVEVGGYAEYVTASTSRLYRVPENVSLEDGNPSRGEIISGQIDADRMDYLRRDSLHCGVDYGKFDWHRLLKTVVVVEDPEDSSPRLGFPSSFRLIADR